MSGHPRFTMTPAECTEHLCRFYDPPGASHLHTAPVLAKIAVEIGHLNAFEDLVHRGMRDINEIKDRSGIGLFSLAVQNRHLKLAKRILELGADPEAVDNNGDNAFHAFLSYSGNRHDTRYTSEILALYPDFIKTRSRSGYTCLHYNVSPEVVRILLEAGAWSLINEPIKDRWGSSPVDCRVLSSVTDSLAILVAYGGRRRGHDERTVRVYNHKGYDILMSRVRACGSVAAIITKLTALKSPVVRGNGRDALRLVARMVWVYRVDGKWDSKRSDN